VVGITLSGTFTPSTVAINESVLNSFPATVIVKFAKPLTGWESPLTEIVGRAGDIV
jgi:hypothetical protein